MPEHLTPGVPVDAAGTGPKPIEGVSTSVAAFIGPTERGPERPHLVTSWPAYRRWFGGHSNTSYMAYAVQGFFDNGGRRCVVCRVAGQSANPARGAAGPLGILAHGRGAWGNRVFVVVKPASDPAADGFRVVVLYYRTVPATVLDPTVADNRRHEGYVAPDVVEDFDHLTHQPGGANNVTTAINRSSTLVLADWTGPAGPPPPQEATALAGGTDGGPLALNDYQGVDNENGIAGERRLGRATGFLALEAVDEVSLVVAPDHLAVAPLTDAVVGHCEKMRDRFAILASPRGLTAGDGRNPRPLRDTPMAAQYHPWVRVHDPVTRDDDYPVPAVGHVAGVYARTDLDSGVHTAPANAVVVGVTNLDQPVTRADQDLFNPVGIDCLRDFRADGRGIRVWAARTMSSDPEWKYVNVRRLFLFVEQSVVRGTRWVAFEPNAAATWARVERSVTGFLTTLWRSGALSGSTLEDAFFVRCDRTTMTPDDIAGGRLVCLIGIAPVKPAEFVIFRIGQQTADAAR